MVGNSHSTPQEGPSASLRRHQSQCSVCSHPERQTIEEEWVNWGSTTILAEKYRLSRDGIYRHAHALGLFRERQKRIKLLYEKVLERLDTVKFSGSDLVKVLKEYTALCGREEAAQATNLPAREVPNPESGQEDEVSVGDGPALEKPTPQPVLEGETVTAAEGNQQCELVVTPLADAEAQDLEPAVANTVQ
jgi:hypothetical protein